MSSYFIESFKIDKLWGYRDINLTFNKNVNILIGPNGSGKTTILNILHSILSDNLESISNITFEQMKIRLKSFKGRSVRTIKVNTADGFLKLKVGQKEHSRIRAGAFVSQKFIQNYANVLFDKSALTLLHEETDNELTALVPLVWLPVNRRLPVTDDEEERDPTTESLESVDLRLKELLEDLRQHRFELNTQLSKRYRDFENQVLSVMLYSKEHDHLDSIRRSIPSSLPTETEKDQLREAFKDAGLLKSKQMRTRIDDHFAEAEKAGKRISENARLELEDILVLPLISRTKSMVEYARELEKYRNDIFAPLHLYEDIVNSFLEDKTIKVDESGYLQIKLPSQSELDWRDLSSGEKQILILLTQALLRLDNPVVYIADEPELSLHVTWQEKLLESLVTLGGQKQVIVATHSPDIVGKFQDNVIDLGRQS